MKEAWILSISDKNKKNKKICCGIWGDGSPSKGMRLEFQTAPVNGGIRFETSNRAWWHWYQFRRYHPDECQGWYAQVTIKEMRP